MKQVVVGLSIEMGIIRKCQITFYQVQLSSIINEYFYRLAVSNGFNLHLEVFVTEIRLTY